MNPKDRDKFRLYYNHTVHPELVRLERRRRKLLYLLLLSLVMIAAIILLNSYVDILAFTLLMMMPVGFYMTYLLYRAQQFRINFKPRVVNLLMDFIDDRPNIQELKYQAEGVIPKEKFLASGLFSTAAPYYKGEDQIVGKIGELDFEMGELDVREISRVRSRLDPIFRGIFMHTTSNLALKGKVLILPEERWEYLTRTIRRFTRFRGKQIEKSLSPEFHDAFLTYATPDATLTNLISEGMQKILVDYRKTSGKEIYISFIEKEIYVAISEPKDILEPYIFKSNVSFDLVDEFLEDILLLIQIVEDFDKIH